MMAWGKTRKALDEAFVKAIELQFQTFVANWAEANMSAAALVTKEQAKKNLERGLRLINEAYEIASKLPG